MTVVLLVIPLVVMAGLYGNVITSLKSGIKLEIASVDPPLATATTTGAKNLGSHSDSAHLLLNNVLVGSSQLARATSCIALNTFSCNNTTNPFSTLTPPPPIQQKNRSKPQLLQLPGKIDNFEEFRLQCLSDCRSDGVLFPPPGVVFLVILGFIDFFCSV